MSRRNPYRRADARTKQARAQGFPARSVFKLEEIDRRVRLLKPGQHVIDLGAAPGSWSMYASKKIGPRGRLLAIDLSPIDQPLGANVTVVQGDAFSMTPDVLAPLAPFHVVLSDMAPSTSGNRERDHARSAELVRHALRVAIEYGTEGGAFVAKLFMGGEFEAVRAEVKEVYRQLRVIRPEGTRRRSVELFLVGLDKRGGPTALQRD